MSDSYGIKDLGEAIAKLLGLRSGDDVEIQRNRLDPNRLMIVRHPQEVNK